MSDLKVIGTSVQDYLPQGLLVIASMMRDYCISKKLNGMCLAIMEKFVRVMLMLDCFGEHLQYWNETLLPSMCWDLNVVYLSPFHAGPLIQPWTACFVRRTGVNGLPTFSRG